MTSNGRRIKVGLFVPQFEGWLAGDTARWSDLAAFARQAEQVGFDSLWLADHLLFRIGQHTAVRQRRSALVKDERDQGVWECWSLLSALAAVTDRIAIGTLVTATSFRNPALLAKMADTVDEISGGRLMLGLGSGAHENDHRAFGYPFDHQISRFEEALEIIVTLLRTGRIDFSGRYYRARECELRPRGPRPAGPPILVGSKGPRMLRLTTTYADAWNTPWCHDVATVADHRETVDAACRTVGRDPASLQRTVSLMVDLPGRETRNQPAWVAAYRGSLGPIRLPPDALSERLLAYADHGISHVQIWLEPNSRAGVDAFGAVLEALDRPAARVTSSDGV
jgi:alkanesulfonate monooxygenase SsuD/methylene tetrahydromethanopterin reductase-like flavin-dependent oxidoreductase (luciferase family)